MAGLSMCEFGWSGIEPMGLYCVDNNLIIIINVDLLDVLLKQKTELFLSLIESIALFSVAFPGMYFIIQMNSFQNKF